MRSAQTRSHLALQLAMWPACSHQSMESVVGEVHVGLGMFGEMVYLETVSPPGLGEVSHAAAAESLGRPSAT